MLLAKTQVSRCFPKAACSWQFNLDVQRFSKLSFDSLFVNLSREHHINLSQIVCFKRNPIAVYFYWNQLRNAGDTFSKLDEGKILIADTFETSHYRNFSANNITFLLNACYVRKCPRDGENGLISMGCTEACHEYDGYQ